MQKPARYGVALLRIRSSLPGLGLTIMFLLLASCDPVEHHNVLTFFFDGVPPLRGETAQTAAPVRKDEPAAAGAPAGSWLIHEPVKDCTRCHGNRQQRGFSPKVQLVAEVPQLCYQCHKEYSTLEGWVHGPVATGDCLLCHEPHKTKTESLLRKPVPELCHRCHEPQAVRAIRNHAEPSYGHCTDCHEGHAGATRNLLRPAFLNKPAGLEYQSEIYRRKYEESLRKARSDLAEGQDFLALSRTIIDYIEVGQLWPARAYLEVLLSSNLLTDSERPLVSEVLQQVTALQTSPPTEPRADTGAESLPGSATERPAAALEGMREQKSRQERGMAELYYRSIKQYHAGQLVEAREGFHQVLSAGSLPGPMKETAQTYLEKIEGSLIQPGRPGWQLLK